MQNSMKVLMVEPHGEGGICHYSYCLSEALQSCGHHILVASANPYELLWAERQFELITPFGAGFKYQQGWHHIVEQVKEQPVAVIHVQFLCDPEQDIHWLEALHDANIPIVLTAHNILPHDALPSAWKIWSHIYQIVDVIIVHYQKAYEELSVLNVKKPIFIIPHGNYLPLHTLVEQHSLHPTDQRLARQTLGLVPDIPILLFFGYMRPYKGIEYLLNAFAHVHAEFPDAVLMIVGTAKGGFSKFARQIEYLGLKDVVIVFPHYVELDQVGCYFTACDLVVLPYIEASQSGVIQLAYAYCRPVVATRVGGLPEAIREGETGLLVSPHSVDELSKALSTLLHDREHCHQLGGQAYRVAKEDFSWDRIAQATSEVYNQIYGSPVSQISHPDS